jgi:hypothetical protein
MATLLDAVMLQAAITAHSVNRTWCAMNGDLSQMPWDEAPDNIQASAIDGVRAIFEGRITKPSDAWENWKAFKLSDGWVYGETEDLNAKTHPNLVDNYEDLPQVERNKDLLYLTVVMSFLPTR